jgi:hypothetical protein
MNSSADTAAEIRYIPSISGLLCLDVFEEPHHAQAQREEQDNAREIERIHLEVLRPAIPIGITPGGASKRRQGRPPARQKSIKTGQGSP